MFLRTALLLLTAAIAWSQIPVEISGRILEVGTTVGIEGVQVEANSYAGITPLHAETKTSATGSFKLSLPQAGNWGVYMKRDGYSIASGTLMSVDVPSAGAPLDLRYFMQRMATITGRVEDADTREPVANLPLSVRQSASGRDPASEIMPSPNSRTDTDGNFSFSGSPGSWVVRVLPRVVAGRVRTSFTLEDIDKVDEDYEDSYWPGGFDQASAIPLKIASGAAGDVGTVRVHKTKYFRVLLSFPAEGCEAGAKFQARIARPDLAALLLGGREVEFSAVCGQDILIAGLKPGSYSAEFYPSGPEPAMQPWSLTRFQITRENVRVKVELRGGPGLEGRFVAAEGAAKLPTDLHGSLMHLNGNTTAERRDFWSDAEGRFHVPNVPLERWYAGFVNSSPPEGWVVSDVRFRGVSMPRNLRRSLSEFNWDGSGGIEIVLDDQPGSVRGIVMNNGKPANDAMVFLYPLPIPAGGYATGWEQLTAPAGSDGAFNYQGLPAGEYRIFALTRAAYLRGSIDRMLTAFPAGSEKVTVARGGTVQADLRLIPDER